MSNEPGNNKPRIRVVLWFIGVLTASVTVSFMISIALLYFFEIPPGNKGTLV